jgi:hypothetical protein
MHISTLLILYRDVTLVISIIKFQILYKKKARGGVLEGLCLCIYKLC